MVAGKSGQETKEVELKFEFDPAELAPLLAHPVLAGDATTETRELISTYYDTEDDVLRKAGVFLRVRMTGEGLVQTIKAAHETQFFERQEWEQPVPTYEPDLVAAEGTALAPLLTPEVRAGLQPRFHTRFRRRTCRLRHDRTEIELAVDQGEITAGLRAAPICELELELRTGDKRALFDLARELAETVPLRLSVKSKAERGFALLDGGDGRVEKSMPVEIEPGMTCAEAFRTVARNCFRQIVANETAMRDGRADALHQMRIGLRRLRAGLSLFAGVVAGPECDHVKGELRWIAQELGAARDLDVFAADVLEPLRMARPDDPDIEAAHRDFADRRAAAYASGIAAVESVRYRRALLDLIAWVETGSWAPGDEGREEEGPQSSIAPYAIGELSRLRRRIKKSGRQLRKLSAGKRHRLRIRAKRLRYATEFFATTFPGKKSAKRRRKSLAALEDLQDALGALNDITVRKALLAGGEAGAEGKLRVPGPDNAEEEKRLNEAERAYRRFAETKAFWKD